MNTNISAERALTGRISCQSNQANFKTHIRNIVKVRWCGRLASDRERRLDYLFAWKRLSSERNESCWNSQFQRWINLLMKSWCLGCVNDCMCGGRPASLKQMKEGRPFVYWTCLKGVWRKASMEKTQFLSSARFPSESGVHPGSQQAEGTFDELFMLFGRKKHSVQGIFKGRNKIFNNLM